MNEARESIPAPGNILVVDDNPANLKLLTGVLAEAGHRARPAPNGRLALSGARSLPPDLILLDINMPEMSGFEVMAALRADARTAEIPVIFVTVQDDIEAKETAFELGAADYVTKPFHRKEVLLRVDNQLRMTRLRAGLRKRTRELEAEIAERERLSREKEQLAVHLRQAHKMEAIGTLVGGLAHNFNNLLSIVLGNLELARSDLPPLSPAAEFLEEIESAAQRARDEIRKLLRFSRGAEEERRPLSIGPVLKDSLRFARSLVSPNMETRIEIADDLPPILGEPIRLHQALTQLYRNAVQAMPKTGGVLEIAVSRCCVGAEFDGGDRCLMPGDYLRIDISDTGHGIPESIRERVFDPYFTTRGLGNCAGMGLSIVHGIVAGHEGRISHHARPGGGTTFCILLPVAEEAEAAPAENAVRSVVGTESLLLVESDPSTARMLGRILETMGYRTAVFTRSEAALARFLDAPADFDLAMLDADIDAIPLANRIREARPDLPLLLCGAYPAGTETEETLRLPGVRWLEKPAERRALAGAVRGLLDGRKPGMAE